MSYLDPYNFNVEVVQLSAGDFLNPVATVDHMKSLSREISEENRSVLMHGTSVGTFAIGSIQVAAAKEQVDLAPVKGVIWDSIVIGTQDNMKDGVVLSTPSYAR